MSKQVITSRELKKAITILKQCQAKLNKLDPNAFSSWGIDSFCEQLDDDIFDLENELQDARDEAREANLDRAFAKIIEKKVASKVKK